MPSKPTKSGGLNTGTALSDLPETLATRALGFVINNPGRLRKFLSFARLSRADVKRPRMNRENLAAVLDYLIADETTLLKFVRAVDLLPEAVYDARCFFGHRSSEFLPGSALTRR